MKRILLIILCFFNMMSNAQQFADKQFYLVDSLVIDSVSSRDKAVLDSSLNLFHNSSNDTIKINIINSIVDNCWDDNVWPKYNNWMYNRINFLLSEDDLNDKLEYKLKSSLASVINNIGYFHLIHGDVATSIEFFHKV